MISLFKNMFSSEANTQLKYIINNGAYLVDVRTPAEFMHGSIKGAVNIPLDKVPAQLEKFRGKKDIVVFCQSGGRSSQAVHFLQQNGIKGVLNGGSLSAMKQLAG